MDIEKIVDITRNETEEVQTSTESSISETMENCRKRLHSSTMTAKRRAQKTGNEDFYEENGKLYCRPCCKIVDHSRQGSIERHKESDGHKRNILKKKKQITLKSTFKISTSARLHNVACVTSWVKACTSANIPLNACVGGSMKEFFEQHVKNGGSIPTTAKGLMPYLKDVYISSNCIE